jgi:hypothetical protein
MTAAFIKNTTRRLLILPILLLLCLPPPLRGQGEATKSFKPSFFIDGLFQLRLSIADNASQDNQTDTLTGFGLPFLRITPRGQISPRINWQITLSADRMKADVLDAFIDYTLSQGLSIRTGLFPVPGAVSGDLTPPQQQECLDRSLVTQYWDRVSLLRSFRSLGVMLTGQFMQNRAQYSVMISNVSGRSEFDTQNVEARYTFNQSGLRLWGRIEAHPIDGLRIGGFYSNALLREQSSKNNSYGANLHFSYSQLTVKMEYLAGEYSSADKVIEWRGFWMSVTRQMKRFVPFIRYDSYSPEIDGSDRSKVNHYDQITLGVHFVLTDSLRLTANLGLRQELDRAGESLQIPNNILIFGVQYHLDRQVL